MTTQYRPENRYFIRANLGVLILPFALFFAYFYLISVKAMAAVYILLGMYLFVLLFLIYQYLYLRKLSWMITDEQIIHTRGVLAIETDYLELYRIYDFSEYSSFIDRLFHIKNICISSTDQSSPQLIIKGISIDIDVLTPLRSQVELMKQKHRIYELSNR